MYAPVPAPDDNSANERPVSAALLGAVSEAYPLRKLWAAVVKRGGGWRHTLKAYSHPGYFKRGGHHQAGLSPQWDPALIQREYVQRLQGTRVLLTDGKRHVARMSWCPLFASPRVLQLTAK
jgi:hypothetical protein